jgi:hypothetical protein
MGTSAIPAALDGLLELSRNAAVVGGTLDGVIVFDGPPVGEGSDELELYIGDDPDDETAGISGTQDFASLGGNAKDETFSIYCTAVSRSGDTDMRAERARAFATLAAVEQLLRQGVPGADPRLGGAVLWSGVGGDIRCTQLQTTKGAYVEVGFNVVCRARI